MAPIFAATLLALSAIYTWTDRDGVEHFTDDPASIPKGVKARRTSGDEVSTVPSPVRPVQPLTAPRAQPPPAQPQVPSPAEQYWREAFQKARARIAELESDIETDRTAVEEVNGLPVRGDLACAPSVFVPVIGPNGQVMQGVGCLPTVNPEFERRKERLAKNRRALARAKEELADLDRRASFEAVPLPWRR